MMDLETLWRIIDEGSTPAIALIAYFLWRLDVHLREFTAEMKGQQEGRDKKLHSIHSDVGAMIRKLAGLKNGE